MFLLSQFFVVLSSLEYHLEQLVWGAGITGSRALCITDLDCPEETDETYCGGNPGSGSASLVCWTRVAQFCDSEWGLDRGHPQCLRCQKPNRVWFGLAKASHPSCPYTNKEPCCLNVFNTSCDRPNRGDPERVQDEPVPAGRPL